MYYPKVFKGMSKIKIFLILASVSLVGLVVGGYLFVEITSRPFFCSSCHLMRPYVKSWEESKHNNVTCIDCHFEPGLGNKLKGKFQAAAMLAKYITGKEGTKPWAEISDKSCMREGCHKTRLLSGAVSYTDTNVKFDHANHLSGQRRSKTLRCTSCHSQIVQGEHIAVTPNTCFLCHFKEVEYLNTEHDSACLKCHLPPDKPLDRGPVMFDHKQYTSRGVSCKECHSDITRGTGEVPKQRCGSCHDKKEHIERYDDTTFLHQMHVTDHKVDCADCHTEIMHSITKLEDMLYKGNECTSCHLNLHQLDLKTYAGTGARGVEPLPSMMVSARVSCKSCHIPTGNPGDGVGDTENLTYEASSQTCVKCHGAGFDKMQDNWQEYFKLKLAVVSAASDALNMRLASSPRPQGAIEEQLKKTVADLDYNLNMIKNDKSFGVHNIGYSLSIMQNIAAGIGSAYALIGADAPSIPVGSSVRSKLNCTTACHIGIEYVKADYSKSPAFDHSKHLEAGVDCDSCHDINNHGTTNENSCHSCHEKQADDKKKCSACHQPQFTARKGDTPYAPLTPPSFMADSDCSDCHVSKTPGGLSDITTDDMRPTCAPCHGEEDVVGTMSKMTALFPERMLDLKKAVTEKAPATSEGRKAREEALAIISLLENANPVHNTALATALLDKTAELLTEIK